MRPALKHVVLVLLLVAGAYMLLLSSAPETGGARGGAERLVTNPKGAANDPLSALDARFRKKAPIAEEAEEAEEGSISVAASESPVHSTTSEDKDQSEDDAANDEYGGDDDDKEDEEEDDEGDDDDGQVTSVEEDENAQPVQQTIRVKTEDTSATDPAPFHTMATCAASLGQGEHPRTLRAPVWIHFPKCGSSLGTLLHNYGCLSKEPTARRTSRRGRCICTDKSKWDITLIQGGLIPWSQDRYCSPRVDLNLGWYQNHIPLWQGRNFAKYRGNFVAMFRDPRARLVSAYNDQKHSFGLPRQFQKRLRDISTLEEYVSFPPIQGCMTKMILGHYCAADIYISPKDLDEAKRRLWEDFAFVGLVDHWTDCICLFHAMHGGKLRDNTLGNSRSHDGYYKQVVGEVMVGPRAGNARYIPSESWKSLPPDADPIDWELFQEAKKVFFHRMREYKLYPES